MIVNDVQMAERIINCAGKWYQVNPSDITGSKRRTRDISRARAMACYLIRENTELTLERISQLIGRNHHTTSLHHWEQMFHKVREDTKAARDAEKIMELVTGRED